MNKGTRLRTFFLVITLLNQANVSLGGMEFGNEKVNLVYKIVSYLLTLGAAVAAFWYNNDFTEEACLGTALTRQLKAEQSEDYIGDYFFTDIDPEEDKKDE